MATSDIAICNMALGAVGARATIASLTEDSNEAVVCAAYFNNIREALLQSARWNFARKQQPLALLKSAILNQSVPIPWVYEYAYPSDCMQGRFIIPTLISSSINPPLTTAPVPALPTWLGPPVDWLVSVDTDSQGNDIRVILTNQMQATFVYTYDCKNPNMYDAQFVTAFVGALAARICVPVSGDKKLAQMAIQAGSDALKSAQASNGNEGLTVQNPRPDWMSVRGISDDYAGFDLFQIAPGQVYSIN